MKEKIIDLILTVVFTLITVFCVCILGFIAVFLFAIGEYTISISLFLSSLIYLLYAYKVFIEDEDE